MLSELATWWARQMRDLLPPALRRWEDGAAAALVVGCADPQGAPPTIVLAQRQRGRDNLLGRFALDPNGIDALERAARPHRGRYPSILELPAAALLERTVTLPLAAERDLASVLTYEIDRITPFRADEIFWRYGVEQRDRANGRLRVRLSLIPKAPLLTLLAALDQVGLSAARIAVPRVGLPACLIDLDRAASRREVWARRSVIGGAILCGGLAAIALILPFILQAVAANAVEQRIGRLRPDVAQAEALRQEIANGTSGIDVMTAERDRVGDALAVLAAVTNALPDDTYLNSFALRQGHLAITGQSAGAAKLIGALSSDPMLRNASFDAPVTHADQAKADLFSIRADVVAAPPAPASARPSP